MKFDTRFREIKTGELLSFSCPGVEDACDLMAFVDKAQQESIYFPWARGKTDLCHEHAAEYIEKFAGAEREALIIVRNDVEIIGLYEITTYHNSQEQPKRCATAPAVLESYQRYGIACQLLEMGFDLARAAGYEYTEAGVDAGNEPARLLLERMGFTLCPRWFRLEKDSVGTLSVQRQYSKKL